ncbi:MAG: N-methyl-L-tryptophan oxidase [Egibacteraceae bacterium]
MAGFDAIVCGLGGMGSAAAAELARRGQRVLGLERHHAVHDLGSSHGGSRIIRQAYFEGEEYVPLLLRAYERWAQVERDSGRELLTITGGLMLGGPDSETVSGALASARKFNLEHEELDSAELRRRFPTLRIRDEVGVYEPLAGFVSPEASVAVHLALAERAGADLRFTESVRSWMPTRSGGVAVTTDHGRYEADRLVVTAGAWSSEVLADLALPLTVERQIQFWFAPPGGVEPFSAAGHPVYIWELADGTQFYGLPQHGPASDGVKVAFFRMGGPTSPETVDRQVHPEEVAQTRSVVTELVPGLDGPLVRAATCLYTTTPDEDFLITAHPEHPQVVLATGFSGHGFKFVSVVGEILADLAIDGSTTLPIELFRLRW